MEVSAESVFPLSFLKI